MITDVATGQVTAGVGSVAMERTKRVFNPGALHSLRLALITGFLFASTGLAAQEEEPAPEPITFETYAKTYNDKCAVCHGEKLEGTAQGPALVGRDLIRGETMADIVDAIATGFPGGGMPQWSNTLSEIEIKTLALYLMETRAGFNYTDLKIETPLEIPIGTLASQEHNFRLMVVIDTLDPLPYSIAPLPDGRILVTEKRRGLRIISHDGGQSTLIANTPKVYNDVTDGALGVKNGKGWLLDVALHPDYKENGWVYLSFTDRCSDCNAFSREFDHPVSMNKLVRGRIRDGAWVDEEVIWQADIESYGPAGDLAAGGRISFDENHHVFLSVGMTGIDNHVGFQDLSRPWGKIHRIYDDGRVPDDNPFVGVEGAIKSIWTYGHRSPEGLEYNTRTNQLWETEMGPRGGDEVNLLLPGGNYGWPLYSLGMNYDGTPVEYGKNLGIEFDLKDIIQPVVDLTPSPAVSSFIFYEGDAFPKWRGDIIVGSLKAATLYRMRLEGNKVVHTETLLSDLARVRDIESGPKGEIYLLIEHATGGQILRLVPD